MTDHATPVAVGCVYERPHHACSTRLRLCLLCGVLVSSLGGYPYCRDAHSCHVDVTDVTLLMDNDDIAAADTCRQFGLQIDSVDHSADGFLHPPFISHLEPGGLAER